jgi:hypothetical protein
MVPTQRVPLVVRPQERGIEDLRNVAETGDLVGTRATCEKLAVACPEGFLEGEKTLTLDEGALYLAVVDCWVDGVANVLIFLLASLLLETGKR